jgi:hypothetical protein
MMIFAHTMQICAKIKHIKLTVEVDHGHFQQYSILQFYTSYKLPIACLTINSQDAIF